jgi:hypothetical protein
VAKKSEAPTNWAQARARIDGGETGDKITVSDAPAAPLGTDAEAGGDSTGAAHIARSAELQNHGDAGHAAAQAPRTAARRQLVPWVVVALVLAISGISALLIAG